jgi:hypothetical protein
VKSVRIAVALALMGLVGWLLGSNPEYRPTSLNLWLALGVAVALLALINAWRSAVPSGSTRGPLILLTLALVISGAALWRSESWVPPTAVLVVGLGALGLGLTGRGDSTGYYQPLRAFAWVPAPRRWEGALPSITKATVALGSAKLDLTSAVLKGSTDFNVSLWFGRLEVQIPADWPVAVCPPAGFGIKIEGESERGALGPPLKLRVLGVAGVVALHRVS